MGRAFRIALLTLVAVGLVWLLFTVVFPWVEVRMEDPSLSAPRV